MSDPIPDIAGLKAQARRIRETLTRAGSDPGHAAALELIARHHGYRDWNTLWAVVDREIELPVRPGQRVSGTYLSHPFQGTVVSVQVARMGWFRIRLRLDEAVDVVASTRFSNWRKQVTVTIDAAGVTAEITSDGEPHLRLDSIASSR